ncbi:DNA-binding response regulator, NarL/FixJ family, contains REC and HTH domains [Bryocella elongata]|uniref:DNA-binding response regulator, NarL/FixJ family, contains REC and HTH domains n=1 Tax=Bryocella elongata TaxID=863522 RepID=A0A1H5U4Q3_9BACT|nr:response regulator transcription factor [Bryocella elongata]SEF70033.1 DNA-binding response regulator, NarL/FixJ family, contains REC and HTH domains [Bryocella elongata]
MGIPVILADNQVIFRTGTARVIAQEPGLEIAAQCPDLERLQEAVGSISRSVVIFPSSMTRDLDNLLDWVKQASSRAIMIQEHGTETAEPVRSRLDGLVLRSVAGPQLTDAIRRVWRGERFEQRATVKEMPSPDRVGVRVLERLTPKELQIVALIAEGYKNKGIADLLGTKEQVVKNYLRSIYDKTGVSDRLELALFTVHHRALADAAARVRAELVKSA